jgi:hypothetical protein
VSSSWRDIASPEAQAELDRLLDVTLDFGWQQLVEHGEFFPFAAAVGTDGAVEMITVHPGAHDDRPASADVVAACLTALRSKRDAIRAGAVASDVRVRAPLANDAIQVDLEHADGHALTVLLPYKKKRRGKIESGTITAQAGEHRIWPIPGT